MTHSQGLITSDPDVMMGKPVFTGTRITVELILEKLGAGESVEQILNSHPQLTEDSIRAAIAYAGVRPNQMRNSGSKFLSFNQEHAC